MEASGGSAPIAGRLDVEPLAAPGPPTVPGRTPVLLAWSGGKDSALALDRLRGAPDLEVVALLTTTTRDVDRVSMHGVRRALVEAQARALDLPLEVVEIPHAADNATYEEAMGEAMVRWRELGVEHVAFGDLFLADVRRYRERQLARVGMSGVFPLWGEDTGDLARAFVRRGFAAWVVCVDPAQLDPGFCGRSLDAGFLADLPPTADPCGENGEFHSFVRQGPGWRHGVACRPGERVVRDGFWFCDLLPGEDGAAC